MILSDGSKENALAYQVREGDVWKPYFAEEEKKVFRKTFSDVIIDKLARCASPTHLLPISFTFRYTHTYLHILSLPPFWWENPQENINLINNTVWWKIKVLDVCTWCFKKHFQILTNFQNLNIQSNSVILNPQS